MYIFKNLIQQKSFYNGMRFKWIRWPRRCSVECLPEVPSNHPNFWRNSGEKGKIVLFRKESEQHFIESSLICKLEI